LPISGLPTVEQVFGNGTVPAGTGIVGGPTNSGAGNGERTGLTNDQTKISLKYWLVGAGFILCQLIF
jgi:hypothetical protein